MHIKTHLAITVLIMLLFIQQVESKLLFLVVVLAASFIPDVDTGFSTLGKFRGFRFLQFFTRHRGVFHSLTFCILISFILALFFPSIAFAFFLAYAIHLFTDSFTVEGIQPFWPSTKTASWKVRTGGRIETIIFTFFVVIDIIVLIFLVL